MMKEGIYKMKDTNNSFDYIYEESITNLSCSILKYYGVVPKHKTIKEIDDVLSSKKNVITILLDGLGSKVLEENLPMEAFLIKNKFMDINSVLPSTTVASTTSFLSGLNPIEHGWLRLGYVF